MGLFCHKDKIHVTVKQCLEREAFLCWTQVDLSSKYWCCGLTTNRDCLYVCM